MKYFIACDVYPSYGDIYMWDVHLLFMNRLEL